MDPEQVPRGVSESDLAAVEFVVAVAENDVIGRDNQMPWHLPADLKHFKAVTLGKHVLMGRKTYDSIGRALPGRTNLVLSRSSAFTAPGCTAVRSVEEARRITGAALPLMVIGGAQVYRECDDVVSRIHLTLVHARPVGDTFFAAWQSPVWHEVERETHPADATHASGYTFMTLARRL